MADRPETVICHYRVIPGREKEFEALLQRHWKTLSRLGAVTDEPSVAYRGEDEKGRPFFVEIFHWKSARAFEMAHQHPEVLAIWEPMDRLCEPRDGRPNMEFPHVERVAL
jgi:hypothetical protein